MKPAVILTADEIRQILADKFGVPIANVLKLQYSYAVITEREVDNNENN